MVGKDRRWYIINETNSLDRTNNNYKVLNNFYINNRGIGPVLILITSASNIWICSPLLIEQYKTFKL